MIPKGKYLENSSYYIGVMPDGEKRLYVNESDFFEDLDYYYEKHSNQVLNDKSRGE